MDDSTIAFIAILFFILAVLIVGLVYTHYSDRAYLNEINKAIETLKDLENGK
jgi:hypothetical protein